MSDCLWRPNPRYLTNNVYITFREQWEIIKKKKFWNQDYIFINKNKWNYNIAGTFNFAGIHFVFFITNLLSSFFRDRRPKPAPTKMLNIQHFYEHVQWTRLQHKAASSGKFATPQNSTLQLEIHWIFLISHQKTLGK